MMKTNSRMTLIGLLAIVVWFVAVFSGSVAKAASPEKSVRIGWLSPLSGFNAEVERMFSDGARLAVQEINKAGGTLGMPIELVNVDSKGSPQGALEACTDLDIRRGVKLIAGTITAVESSALIDYAKDHKVLGFVANGQDDAFTAENFNQHSFRTPFSVYVASKAFAMYVASRPWTKIYIAGRDDSHGHELVHRFWLNMRKLKPEVKSIGESWSSLSVMDFTSVIAAIAASKADACLAAHYGARCVSFLRQAQAFGLFDKMTVMDMHGLAADCSTALGKQFPARGVVAVVECPWWVQEPAMQKFVRAHTEFTGGVYPGFLSYGAYRTIHLIAKAIERAKATDVDNVIRALEGLTMDTPAGPIRVRNFDHQVISPIWVAEGAIDPQYPIAVGINMTKYGEEVFPTKEQVEAVRKTRKWE